MIKSRDLGFSGQHCWSSGPIRVRRKMKYYKNLNLDTHLQSKKRRKEKDNLEAETPIIRIIKGELGSFAPVVFF